MGKFYDTEKSNLREKVLSTRKPSRIHEDFLECVGRTFPNKRILDIGTGNGYILHEIEDILRCNNVPYVIKKGFSQIEEPPAVPIFILEGLKSE